MINVTDEVHFQLLPFNHTVFFFCTNVIISLSPFADLSIQHVNPEKSENLKRHRTEGFSSSSALVVRRGAPFRISLQLKGRPFNPKTDTMKIKVMLGNLD